MKLLKLIVPTTLLAIMLLISGRYFVFLSFVEIQKPFLKNEAIYHSKTVTRQIASSDLYINKNGVEWKDNNSEVVINGEYYEVVQINQLQNGYELVLRSDTKESHYYETYFNVEEDEDGKEKNISVFQLLLDITFISGEQEKFINYVSSLFSYPRPNINFNLNVHLHRLIKPPCSC